MKRSLCSICSTTYSMSEFGYTDYWVGPAPKVKKGFISGYPHNMIITLLIMMSKSHLQSHPPVSIVTKASLMFSVKTGMIGTWALRAIWAKPFLFFHMTGYWWVPSWHSYPPPGATPIRWPWWKKGTKMLPKALRRTEMVMNEYLFEQLGALFSIWSVCATGPPDHLETGHSDHHPVHDGSDNPPLSEEGVAHQKQVVDWYRAVVIADHGTTLVRDLVESADPVAVKLLSLQWPNPGHW